MARDLPIGNGSLLINFDRQYQLRDLYFPHVGKENHSAGHPFRFGVWANGPFRWIDDDLWQREMVYESDTLVTRTPWPTLIFRSRSSPTMRSTFTKTCTSAD